MISRALEIVDPYLGDFSEWITDISVHRISLKALLRLHGGAACIAGGVAIYATNPLIISPLLPLAIIMLWVGLILSPRAIPRWPILTFVGVIVASALIAIPFAEHLAPTLLLAILTLSVAPLVFLHNPFIWNWLLPVWLIHAAIAFWQWFALDLARVDGITGNANSAAVLLLLGSTYLLNGNSKLRWVMIPLLVSLLFTGARWTVLVGAVTLLAMFLSRYTTWRYVAVGAAVAVIVTLSLDWRHFSSTWIRPSTARIHITGEGFRTEAKTGFPSLIPQGFSDNGIHMVPWRMMHETGLLSGVAWIGAVIFSLSRKPDMRWWMLLVVALSSLMYYHTWVGPLAGFWWLLVSPQKEPPRGQKSVPAVYEPYKPG